MENRFRENSIEGWFRKKLRRQGAQKPRSEADEEVRRSDEVEAQSRSERDPAVAGDFL
jgi:hypothetical protein